MVHSTEKFRARFRFRVQNRLNINAKQYQLLIDTHDVVLSPESPDVNICESEWLVMNAAGFDSEEEALKFVRKLKTACDVSSIGARFGIDSGTDLSTTSFGETVKDRLQSAGVLLRNNIHGIDVFQDNPITVFGSSSATLTLLVSPDSFLADINRHFLNVDNTSQKTKDIVLLLNYSLMRPEPVARIVFAFSAVEMLGQDREWSADQIRLRDQLAEHARNQTVGSQEERDEVADTINNIHRVSLRQGVLRLLNALELGHLKQIWDDLYRQRSTLVHGLAPKPGESYTDLAHKTVSLCGQILLKAVATELKDADHNVSRFYDLN